jgi:hypothetical protein
LTTKIRDVVDSLNFALLGLVDRFIQLRGFAYKKVLSAAGAAVGMAEEEPLERAEKVALPA